MKNQYSIIRYPARVLASKAEDVYVSASYFERMLIKFRRANQLAKGYAIAAPQLGIAQQFFYYNHGGEEFIAANPEIVRTSEEVVTDVEACLSVPGKDFTVPRYEWIEWSWDDPTDGVAKFGYASGLKARIIQHEIDHLNGLCLPDKFTEV